jgi:hypothetical protein
VSKEYKSEPIGETYANSHVQTPILRDPRGLDNFDEEITYLFREIQNIELEPDGTSRELHYAVLLLHLWNTSNEVFTKRSTAPMLRYKLNFDRNPKRIDDWRIKVVVTRESQ